MKIGEDHGFQQLPNYELDLNDFVQPINFEHHNITVDPRSYFTTSGDAIIKAQQLEHDLVQHALKLDQIDKDCSKLLFEMAGRTRGMIYHLEYAKGPAKFLEIEWIDHVLICVPKNPRGS